MGILITEPIKTVNGLLTKAIAARSQLLYKVQREDYEVTGGGGSQLNIADTTGITVGDQVYFKGIIDASYLGIITIVNPTNVHIDPAPNQAQTGYLNNLSARQNYRLNIDVFDKNDVRLFENTFPFIPNQAGLAIIDIGELMSLKMQAEPEVFSQEYCLTIAEQWKDSPQSVAYDVVLCTSLPPYNYLRLDASYGDLTALFPEGSEAILDLTSVQGAFIVNAAPIFASGETSVPFNDQEVSCGLGTMRSSKQPWVIKTETLQAIYAKKQLLSVGGANMWENLLRESGETKTQSFTRVVDAGGGAVINIDSVPTDNYILGQIIKVVSDSGLYNNSGIISTVGAGAINIVMPFLGDDTGVAIPLEASKLLTKFKNPLMWRGWNRLVSSLVDSEYINRNGGNTSFLRVRNTDINKTEIGVNVNIDVSSNATPRIITYKLIEPESNASYIACYAAGSPGQAILLSNDLYYKILLECPQPVMLDWINSLGGIDQHLFSINQDSVYETKQGVLAERPVTEDIENVYRTKQRFPGSNVQRMTLMAEHLTQDQLLALKEIKATHSLRLYLTKDGSLWIDVVVVDDFTTEMSSKYRLFKYAITVEFPDEFDFYEGKRY